MLAKQLLKTDNPVQIVTPQKYTHWLQYPQEEMPQYIIDAKKRLNQIHPRTPPHVKKVEAVSLDEPVVKTVEENVIVEPKPVAKHFLTYESPETPEEIRDIRRRFRDERYKRDDGRKLRVDYSSMKPNELNKYLMAQNSKNAVSIPVPNVNLQTFSEPQALLNRSKSSLGFERATQSPQVAEQQQIQKLQVPQQNSQQPITIIYNHFEVPNNQGSKTNPTPEYLAAVATNIAANNYAVENEAKKQDSLIETESKSEESKIESRTPISNETQNWLNNEWDKYYGYEENKKDRTESKISFKSKTPSPTLNEFSDKVRSS